MKRQDINRLFAATMAGYRAGKVKPISMSSAAKGDLYRSMAQSVVRERLGDEDHAHYVAVRDMSRRAVQRTKGREYGAAGELFRSASDYLLERACSEEVRLLGESWIHQGSSYLEARLKNWNGARERLRAAMESDQELEVDYGYDLFHMGRVNLVHLLVRVEVESGDLELGVDLAQQIVNYVHGERETLPLGEAWSSKTVLKVPIELRRAMLARVSGEVGTVLAGVSLLRAQSVFARFPAWNSFAGHASLSEIYDWGRAKEAFLSGNTVDFLARCARFLETGVCETALWYALALDFCSCVGEMRPSVVRLFCVEVSEDSALWKDLPASILAPSLRAKLSKIGEGAATTRPRYVHTIPERRFHAIGVGLPRTGISSLSSLFGRYRSGNEFMERETITQLARRNRSDLSEAGFRHYLIRRDSEGGLEMDSAGFNHFYLDLLIDEFPDANFLFTVRHPCTWLNSYLKMLLRWRVRFDETGVSPPAWTADYGSLLFERFTWDTFASPDNLRRSLPELVDSFFEHWRDANGRVLSLLPENRSLVLFTHELSSRRETIARFVGIPANSLTDDHHTNASPDSDNILATLEPAYLEERRALYTDAVMNRLGLPQQSFHAKPFRA